MNWTKEAERIKLDEGYRGRVYADTVGIKTIGYGRNLEGVGVSKDEAEVLFHNDLRRAFNACKRLIPVFPYLDDDRQGVLVNMAYNLGGASLGTFKDFLAALERLDFEKAADEMKSSKWYAQVGPRAERLVFRMRVAKK